MNQISSLDRSSPSFAKLASLKHHACAPLWETCNPEHEHLQCSKSPDTISPGHQVSRFSLHAFHLEGKIEVFTAEGSQIHENARSSSQLNTSTFSAPNHQVTHHQVTKSAGSAHMPFNLKEKLKFSVQRSHKSTKTPDHFVS